MYIRTKEEEQTRDRGVLTPADRKFLAGDADIQDESKRQARQRIRNRVKNSIRDFWYVRGLSDKDRKMIADELWADDGPLWQGYIDMLAFFYRMTAHDEGTTMYTGLYNAITSVEDRLQAERGTTVNVDLNFRVERSVVHNHADLLEKFENNDPMTPEEVHTLIIESDQFDHLRKEDRWKKFHDFLSGDLEVPCIVEEDDDWVPYA